MTRFIWLISLALCLALLCQQWMHAGTPSKTVPLKDSWIVVHPPSPPQAAETEQQQGAEVLKLTAPPNANSILIAPKVSLSGFGKLSFRLWSERQSIVAVYLQDCDNATFHAPVPIEANVWKQVVVTPADFVLNDDSPVKKTSLDPRKVIAPLRILELGKLVGNQQPNLLKLSAMHVDYGAAANSDNIDIPATINGGTITITKSGSINHPISIINGGKLIIKAHTIHMCGNLSLDSGTFELDGGSLIVDNRFPHQIQFSARNHSKLDLRGCSFSSPYMSQLNASDSQVNISDCVFNANGFTMSPERSTMVLTNAQHAGELIVQSECHYRISNCEGLLVWLRTGEKEKVDIALPDSNQAPLKSFTLPKETDLDLSIANSRSVTWALITIPRANVTIRNTEIRAVGMVFPESGPIKVSNLVDDVPITHNPIDVADRRLSFINSKVRAFNFYPNMCSRLQVDDCTFGEVNGFNKSDFVARNCTCDGAGGYVHFSNQSTGHLVNCKLNCPVVASDDARLTLENCTVNGPSSASDHAIIFVKDCKLNGSKQEIGAGKILPLKP